MTEKSNFTYEDTLLADKILLVLEKATSPSKKPGSDQRRDGIAAIIRVHMDNQDTEERRQAEPVAKVKTCLDERLDYNNRVREYLTALAKEHGIAICTVRRRIAAGQLPAFNDRQTPAPAPTPEPVVEDDQNEALDDREKKRLAIVEAFKNVKIQKGVPIPPDGRDKNRREPYKPVFDGMQVGDMIEVRVPQHHLTAIIAFQKRRTGHKFTTRRVDDNTTRCWRIE